MPSAAVLHRALECEPDGIPLRIQVPGGEPVLVTEGGDHPVLGPTNQISTLSGEVISSCGRVDWRRPERIPPVAEPARLPPAAGTALLNLLATAAPGPLRYRGPYPSAALYHSLSDCFRPSASLDEFVAGGELAAAAGREVEPLVDFIPAPFIRLQRGRVCAQLRDGAIEAAFVDRHRFGRSALAGRRLVAADGGKTLAVFDVAGQRLHTLTELSDDGHSHAPVRDPAPLDRARFGNLGRQLPAAVSRAIASTLIASAPVLLRPALAALATEIAFTWSDTGLALARARGDSIEVHAAFATGELAPALLLASLIEAVTPVAFGLAQARLVGALS